jgi:FkbM family methyltransferase
LRIDMYEPVKRYYDLCIARFGGENTRVYNFGMSNDNEELTIYKDKDNLGVNTIYKPEKLFKFEEEKIVLKIFDEVNTLERVDLIKIDVEGAEYLVLEGMRNTILRDKPIILLENGWHRDDTKILAKVRENYEWLFANGYKRFDYDLSEYEDLVFVPNE